MPASTPAQPSRSDDQPEPTNRAARRGRARGRAGVPTPERGSSARAQVAAQGRRINPIRRTG